MRVWNTLYLFIENLATYYLIFFLLSALHRVDKPLVCILAFNPFKKEGKNEEKNIPARVDVLHWIYMFMFLKFKVCLIYIRSTITVRAPAIRIFWQVSFIHSLLDYVHIYMNQNSIMCTTHGLVMAYQYFLSFFQPFVTLIIHFLSVILPNLFWTTIYLYTFWCEKGELYTITGQRLSQNSEVFDIC